MSGEQYDLRTRQRVDADPHGLFDDLLSLEEDFTRQGRQEGIAHGTVLGKEEGFQLGVSKGLDHVNCVIEWKHDTVLYNLGSEIGSEVAFYEGCLYSWMSIRNAMPSLKFTPRCTLHLHSTSCDV
jgi:hypothetical protein